MGDIGERAITCLGVSNCSVYSAFVIIFSAGVDFYSYRQPFRFGEAITTSLNRALFPNEREHGFPQVGQVGATSGRRREGGEDGAGPRTQGQPAGRQGEQSLPTAPQGSCSFGLMHVVVFCLAPSGEGGGLWFLCDIAAAADDDVAAVVFFVV